MSEPNNQTSRCLTPSRSQQPTKTHILQWIHTLLPSVDPATTVESLGNGAIYCKLLNHYMPHSIAPSRIISEPINEYESCLNLKQLQLAMSRMRIPIAFDINKISKQRYTQNWNLVSAIYKHLQGNDNRKGCKENSAFKRCHPEISRFQQSRYLNETSNKSFEESKVPEERKPTPKKSELFSRGSSLTHLVDRIKEIVLSSGNDSYKMHLISSLLCMGGQVKVEQQRGGVAR